MLEWICNICYLSNLKKEPTCFKNPKIYFLQTRLRCFQNALTIETDTSGFHEMVVAVLQETTGDLQETKTKNHSIQEL